MVKGENTPKQLLLNPEPILTKHGIDTWVILIENCSKIWNPCRILYAMPTKGRRKKKKKKKKKKTKNKKKKKTT